MWLLLTGLVGFVLLPLLLWVALPWYIAFTLYLVLLSWKPSRSEMIRQSFLGPKLRETVQYTTVCVPDSQELEENAQYIFAMHPHGLFAFSEMLTFVFHNPYTALKRHAVTAIPLVATELLWLPLLGHLAAALGCESVDRENLELLLAQKRSVAITPGGVREAKHAHDCSDQHVTLRKCDAFLKIAYAKSVAVVPMLVTGEHGCYRFLPSVDAVQNLSIRLFGWPFPLFALGRWLTFWPRRSGPLTVSFGSPVCREDAMTEEEFISCYYSELNRIAVTTNVELCYVDVRGHAISKAGATIKERSESTD